MRGQKLKGETTLTGMLSNIGIRSHTGLKQFKGTETYSEQTRRMLRGDGMMPRRRPDADMTRSMTHVGEGIRLSVTLAALTTMTADLDRQSSNVGRKISLKKSDTSKNGWQDIHH